ncbi:MAG: Gmad2 immunoglobulin-like domain-containing protein [Patescibacteria group bacterium]
MKRVIASAAVLLLVGTGCAGGPVVTPIVTETYPPVQAPAQIQDPNGPEAKADLVVADVAPGDQVSSPLVVTGRARGYWYFEASFPAELLDANGAQLAIAPAQAQSDWMTTDFVPFSVTLAYPTPATATGTLMLRKDNPSGEPQNDDFLAIPVTF